MSFSVMIFALLIVIDGAFFWGKYLIPDIIWKYALAG